MTETPSSIDQLAEGFAHITTLEPMHKTDPVRVYRTFRDAFDTDAGQRVLGWIMQEAGLFPPAEELASEEQIRAKAGRRYMAQWILKHYAHKPAEPKDTPKDVPPLDRK